MGPDTVLSALTHYGIEFQTDRTDAQFLCPFHEEDTPSCRMSLEQGLFYCFGCGASGRLMDFLTRMEEDDPVRALRVLRRVRNGDSGLDTATREKLAARSREPEEPFDYVQAFSRYSRMDWALIPRKHAVYQYFVVKRGISPYTMTAFDARLTESDDYPVAIPIFQSGDMVGYVKRYVGDDPVILKGKKYLYNRGFSASEHLAFHRVGTNGPCLVVEGMLDYLKASQFGARTVAAILSWRIKPKQAEFLRAQGVEEVVCALDNSPTGREGCELLRQHFRVRQFGWPGDHVKDVGDLGSSHEFWMGYEGVAE